MNKNNVPFLYYNFLNANNDIEALQFTNPIKIFTTDSIDEVIPCLTEIQENIDQGFYAAGYFSYESAQAFNKDNTVNQNSTIPLLWFGIYNKPIKESLDSTEEFITDEWHPTVTKKSYYESIDYIHKQIKESKTKQVNYTIKLKSKLQGDSFSFYKQIEEAQSAHYSAYLDIGDYTIMSASPELFFQLKDNVITTKPMKGTIERDKTNKGDLSKAAWLKTSQKNRTENELITQLMKAELDEITLPHTIEIMDQFKIEKYPTLYQMTSTLKGMIKPTLTLTDLLKTLFPSGSITGSPKHKTMDIIHQLEPEAREIYCGAIGFITPDNEAIFNVPIRTVLLNNQTSEMEYGVGGGITIDSTKEDEYLEVLTKAKLLTKKRINFELLETIGVNNGTCILLSHHMKRLNNSAEYFDFIISADRIEQELIDLAKQTPKGRYKIRLVLSNNGNYSLEVDEIYITDQKKIVALAKHPIDKEDVFFYHKTTHRAIYDAHKDTTSDVFDVLLWNKDKEVTEFTTGNVVVSINGKLITPPIECGVLPGTFREALLYEKKISEQKINLHELENAEQIWFINSVREWILVDLK